MSRMLNIEIHQQKPKSGPLGKKLCYLCYLPICLKCGPFVARMQAKIKDKIRQNQAFDREIIFIGILFELFWIQRGIYK